MSDTKVRYHICPVCQSFFLPAAGKEKAKRKEKALRIIRNRTLQGFQQFLGESNPCFRRERAAS